MKAATDRNIIVHGLVHAAIITGADIDRSTINIPLKDARLEQLSRVPCWTVFMGEGKEKNYQVSTEAVSIVLDNIQKLGVDLREFNLEQ
jgi:hypothetical protein